MTQHVFSQLFGTMLYSTSSTVAEGLFAFQLQSSIEKGKFPPIQRESLRNDPHFVPRIFLKSQASVVLQRGEMLSGVGRYGQG